jgi:multiple antibiotic resistance protein
MGQELLDDFVSIWVVVDPIGSLPVFIAVTAGMAAAQRRKTAFRAVLISMGLLLGFVVVGQLLLELLKIPLLAFQIAGGLVLFLFALTMIFGPSKPETEKGLSIDEGQDVAVFPLAVPSIASPGAMMAVVVLTDNSRYSIAEQAMTGVMMLLVLAVTLVLLLCSGPILRRIGDTGASIVSRVMGLILAAVATENVLSALKLYFREA